MVAAPDMTASERRDREALWDLRRPKKIGSNGSVDQWIARLPRTEFVVPMLEATFPADVAEWTADPDLHLRHTTFIWAWTEEARLVASRIALSIAETGFAWICRSEIPGLAIQLGRAHRLSIIGGGRVSPLIHGRSEDE